MKNLEIYIDKNITKMEALNLYNLEGKEILDVFKIANKVREKYCKNDLEVCTISNIKFGNCSEDCKFCAQGSSCIEPFISYELKDKKIIVDEFINASKNKIIRFGLVSSGKKIKIGTKDFDKILEMIREIKRENEEIEICCSLGLLGKEELLALKEVGVKRYHSNIQTSPEKYSTFAATTHSVEDRINTIKIAKKIGLKVCSGGIIGMGESIEDRIEMALFLKKLDVDGIPINVLNPIKGTPYENRELLSPLEILKTIAIFRIILKDKNIKVAAGRESILKDFMATAFLSGANGMLVGGYLTLKGRKVLEDIQFIENIKLLWK